MWLPRMVANAGSGVGVDQHTRRGASDTVPLTRPGTADGGRSSVPHDDSEGRIRRGIAPTTEVAHVVAVHDGTEGLWWNSAEGGRRSDRRTGCGRRQWCRRPGCPMMHPRWQLPNPVGVVGRPTGRHSEVVAGDNVVGAPDDADGIGGPARHTGGRRIPRISEPSDSRGRAPGRGFPPASDEPDSSTDSVLSTALGEAVDPATLPVWVEPSMVTGAVTNGRADEGGDRPDTGSVAWGRWPGC